MTVLSVYDVGADSMIYYGGTQNYSGGGHPKSGGDPKKGSQISGATPGQVFGKEGIPNLGSPQFGCPSILGAPLTFGSPSNLGSPQFWVPSNLGSPQFGTPQLLAKIFKRKMSLYSAILRAGENFKM